MHKLYALQLVEEALRTAKDLHTITSELLDSTRSKLNASTSDHHFATIAPIMSDELPTHVQSDDEQNKG